MRRLVLAVARSSVFMLAWVSLALIGMPQVASAAPKSGHHGGGPSQMGLSHRSASANQHSHNSGASASHNSGASATDPPASSHQTQGTSGTFGNPTQPQPLSNADHNPGGANNGGNCGAYCSTRHGAPSLNGNGNGKATGKPCAGCVGRADNKNPPGQQPNGSDHNAGYECDRNHGVGRTNPAHTGCRTSAPTPKPPPKKPPKPPKKPPPTAKKPPPTPPKPPVPLKRQIPPEFVSLTKPVRAPTPTPTPEFVSSTHPSALPFTGLAVGWIAGLGGVLLACGSLLLLLRRRAGRQLLR